MKELPKNLINYDLENYYRHRANTIIREMAENNTRKQNRLILVNAAIAVFLTVVALRIFI